MQHVGPICASAHFFLHICRGLELRSPNAVHTMTLRHSDVARMWVHNVKGQACRARKFVWRDNASWWVVSQLH